MDRHKQSQVERLEVVETVDGGVGPTTKAPDRDRELADAVRNIINRKTARHTRF